MQKLMNLKLRISTKLSDFYRGTNDFKKCYQARTNIVKEEKCYFTTDSHNILGRWRNHSFQLFNVHGVSEVWQTEIHTAQ
jgi:hypothetical protein